MSGPLTGVRILDLTTVISGPYATMILGDQGADVIKIEMPSSGDYIRALGNRRNGLSAMLLNVNRNKRSLTIDLKSPKGVELLKKLTGTADVVVQNFRPGVVERLGIGPSDLRAIYPRLIYVSMSGFGASGPLAHKPTYDPIVQAISGLTSIQGGADANRPRLVRTILPDKLTAVTASQAITAALFARERTGRGQHVTLNMLDSMLSFLWASDMGAHTFADEPTSAEAAASFIDLIYETANGHMTVAIMSDKEWIAFTKAIGKPEWLRDPRFSSAAMRDTHVNDRLAMMQEVLSQRTTDEWLQLFEGAGVPCAPVLTRQQVVGHPQVQASGAIVEYSHPVAGKLKQARAAARFDDTPTSIRRGAPRLGQHNTELMRELGVSATEIQELQSANVLGAENYDDVCTV